MEKQPSTTNRMFLFVLTGLGWFALIAQFYINLNKNTATTAETIIQYFSYFTILTNLILAICTTVLLLKPNSIFHRQSTLTALTVYILIVGIIYNAMLRFLWHPTGLQIVVDELLHTVIPIMFVMYWIMFVEKDQLSRKAVFPWMIYPVLYTIFILFRGSVTGFYPYPFINIAELGFQKVMVNALGIAAAFVAVSLLFVGIGNFRNNNTYQTNNYSNT